MAARRAERLVNLVICLLSTRQYVTADRIREVVPGYDDPGDDPGDGRSDEAFKRMFERDKAELRDLGIPLETGRNSIWDAEDGYRIPRGNYELPPIEFEPAEAAAVGLAARLWQSATLAAPARSAVMKLRAGGADVDPVNDADTADPIPHVDAADPSLAPLIEAARTARVVRFDYQKSGAEHAERRTVEPWGVLSWHRRWYLVGFDRDRDEARSFRLSRITGRVEARGAEDAFERPPGGDLLGYVTQRGPDVNRVARIRVAATGAGRLRRLARDEQDGVLSVPFADTRTFARQVAAAGRSATVLEPSDLVEAVRELLRAAGDAAVAPR